MNGVMAEGISGIGIFFLFFPCFAPACFAPAGKEIFSVVSPAGSRRRSNR